MPLLTLGHVLNTVVIGRGIVIVSRNIGVGNIYVIFGLRLGVINVGQIVRSLFSNAFRGNVEEMFL